AGERRGRGGPDPVRDWSKVGGMSDPKSLTGEALAAIGKAQTPADLERIETEYLGRKSGHVSRLLSNIGQLPPEQKAALGKSANEAQRHIEAAPARRPPD